MKTAIVGCGNISRLHFAAVDAIEDVKLCACCDIKPERAEKFAEKYGLTAYTSFDEMLDREKPDTIHICTPHYLHTPMAVKALERGINVFCEKPCSVSDGEVKLLREAQEKSSASYGVCFQNRYNSCIRYIRRASEKRQAGKLLAIRAFVTWCRGSDYYSDDWHGTLDKEGGCLLINQAIHTIDLIEYIGGKVRTVTAHVSNDHLQGVIEGEDTASIRMELENGVNAVFYGTTAYGSNAPVLIECAFENLTLRAEGEKLFEIGSDGSITEIGLDSLEAPGEKYWGSGHGAIIGDFYSCLREGRAFSVDAFSGGNAPGTVFAAYRSSLTGKTEERI